jgi:hypothetical protein
VRGGGYMFAPEVTRSGPEAPRAVRDESPGIARSGA